jgi:hypothetical protein
LSVRLRAPAPPRAHADDEELHFAAGELDFDVHAAGLDALKATVTTRAAIASPLCSRLTYPQEATTWRSSDQEQK